MSKPLSSDDLLRELTNTLADHIRFWASDRRGNISHEDRLYGVVHSCLTTLDGLGSDDIPALNLVVTVDDDYVQEKQADNEDWYPDGTTLSCMLHEHLVLNA